MRNGFFLLLSVFVISNHACSLWNEWNILLLICKHFTESTNMWENPERRTHKYKNTHNVKKTCEMRKLNGIGKYLSKDRKVCGCHWRDGERNRGISRYLNDNNASNEQIITCHFMYHNRPAFPFTTTANETTNYT